MRDDERGTTIVEFAIISSVLFTLLFGLIDLGIIELGNSVGSNAAREGVRVGIINFACADGSTHTGCPAAGTNFNLISTAVQSHLNGVISGFTMTIRCIDGTTTNSSYPSSATKSCDPATIVPGIDLIEVTASWNSQTTSLFASNPHHTEVARQVIVGTPTASGGGGGGGSPGCIVSSMTVTPNPASVNPAPTGTLTSNLVVTVVTNNDSTCTGIQAQFTTASPVVTRTLTIVGSGPNYSATVSTTSSFSESNNPQTVTILNSAGTTTLLDGQFNIGGCQVNSVTFSPVAGTSSNQIPVDSSFHPTTAETVTAATNGDSGCANLKAVYNTAAPNVTHSPMSGTGPNYTDAIGTGSSAPTFAAANPQTVEIETSTGTVIFTQQFYVQTPVPAPIIMSCSQSDAKKSKADTITIIGSNFTGTSSVTFTGGVTAPGTPTITSTQITIAVTNVGSAGGPYGVTVTNGTGSGSLANCITITN